MSDEYKTLGKRLSHLVANPLDSDFTFYITEDDQAVPAHKIIIAAGSPVLQRIVYGLELAQSLGTSETVAGISSENFIELLRFLYTDTANVNEKNAIEILFKANYYGITELENICVRVLISSLTVQNVLSIYQQVGDFEICNRLLDCLRHRCKRIIAFRTKLAFESDDFLKLSLDGLRLILDLPALNIDSVELFWKLLKWARNECGRKILPKTQANARLVHEGVEKKVGFEAMSAEEFQKCRHLCEGFFNEEDIDNVHHGGEACRAMTLFKDAVWIARKKGHQLPPSAVFISNSRCSYIGRYYDRGSYHYIDLNTQCNNRPRNNMHFCMSFEVLCGSGYEWTEINELNTDSITNAVALNNSDDHPLILTRNTIQKQTEENGSYSCNFTGNVFASFSLKRASLEVHTFDFAKFDEEGSAKNVHSVKKQYYLNGKNAKPPLEPGVIPSDAVIGGTLRDGTPVYVCLAIHDGDMLPGYHIPSQGFAYVSHGMQSHAKIEYELIRHPNPMWVPSRMGLIPLHAVHGGHTANGEELFICRCRLSEGNWIPGKVLKSQQIAYIAYDNTEMSFQDYEVLVEQVLDD